MTDFRIMFNKFKNSISLSGFCFDNQTGKNKIAGLFANQIAKSYE
ncbi:MAG: hypothetical protein K0R25_31 [Rickettsiaceae bacterium]|jgi:hypothetical protein|nr:hypothetical protein [Rickettsiaceae bacterium]